MRSLRKEAPGWKHWMEGRVGEVKEYQIVWVWSKSNTVKVFLTSEFWLFFFFSLSYILSSVNHLMIFWLRAEGNLFTTTLNDFISENYLITWYVLSLPIWVLDDLSKKLERLEGTWRKCVGSCKGKMKVSHKCPSVECECTTHVLQNMKLECDHDVSINAHTQCFKGVWVVETRLFWFSLKQSKIRKCKTKNTVLILFSIEWWKLQ